MTQQQRALIRYWLTGLCTILILVIVFFWVGDLEQFRWFLLPAIFFAAYMERNMRPIRPAEAPTPHEIIQSSRAWTLFFVVYALSAVVLAVLSITFGGLGTWLSDNPWLVGPLILAPLVFPLIQSELNLYKVLGNE
jgi:hypothetical protein